MKSLKNLVLVAFSSLCLGLTHPTPINYISNDKILIDLAQIIKLYNPPPSFEMFGYNNELYKGYKYELITDFGSFLYVDIIGEGCGSVTRDDGFGLNFSGREYGFIGFNGPEDPQRNNKFWEDLESFTDRLEKETD